MPSHTLDAPAKINLHLRILGKREDGFHALETRLAPLELADRVTLTADASLPEGAVVLTCDDFFVLSRAGRDGACSVAVAP